MGSNNLETINRFIISSAHNTTGLFCNRSIGTFIYYLLRERRVTICYVRLYDTLFIVTGAHSKATYSAPTQYIVFHHLHLSIVHRRDCIFWVCSGFTRSLVFSVYILSTSVDGVVVHLSVIPFLPSPYLRAPRNASYIY